MISNISWFVYSISATITFGIALSLYKVPAIKNVSKISASLWTVTVSFLLSCLFFYKYFALTNAKVILFSAIWGVQFTSIITLQMLALKKMETNTLFPLTTITSLIITLVFGILFFNQGLSTLQVLGMLGAVLIIIAYTAPKEKIRGFSLNALVIASGIVALSVIGKIVQKIAADQIDIHIMQIFQYAFAIVAALTLLFTFHKKDWKKQIHSGAKIGSFIGIFSFIGGYLLLIALTKGPFPLITTIHSSYIFITALLGFFIFKEKLNTRKVILILLALIAIALMRLG